jgi:hypothetical protein
MYEVRGWIGSKDVLSDVTGCMRIPFYRARQGEFEFQDLIKVHNRTSKSASLE